MQGGLQLLELLLFLPVVNAEGWGICAWGLVFMDWGLWCGLGSSFIFLKYSLLRVFVFNLTLYKCSVFCFTNSILRYSFFLYLHLLSYDVWALLHNGYFCTLSRGHSKVQCRPKQTPYFAFREVNQDINVFIVIKTKLVIFAILLLGLLFRKKFYVFKFLLYLR